MMTIQRLGTTRRFSDAVTYNKTVYIVEVPANLDADISAQTENLLASVARLLQQAGSDASRILQATIYLADIGDYDAMNRVWDAWVPEGSAPVRACVEARLAHPKYKVEIVLTAACLNDCRPGTADGTTAEAPD
ncbi:RidA family protein [Rhodocyclus tenuis]|uniref:RidA family protein n=2 Tax=Rhodocyclus TaxID=1064 RepID=A0A6L5JU87_RHOTE|nr:RidA family protein [Rhodocyclus gracilis]